MSLDERIRTLIDEVAAPIDIEEVTGDSRTAWRLSPHRRLGPALALGLGIAGIAAVVVAVSVRS